MSVRWKGKFVAKPISTRLTSAANETPLYNQSTELFDNLSPHKHDATLRLIEQAGAAVRFLPAYSPDLNPIEKMWSKVKQLLRSAEARTREELQTAIAAALACVTAQDARNWFASCGYSFI